MIHLIHQKNHPRNAAGHLRFLRKLVQKLMQFRQLPCDLQPDHIASQCSKLLLASLMSSVSETTSVMIFPRRETSSPASASLSHISSQWYDTESGDAGVDLGDAMDEASSAAAGRLQRLRPRLGSAAVAILVATITGASKLGCSLVLSQRRHGNAHGRHKKEQERKCTIPEWQGSSRLQLPQLWQHARDYVSLCTVRFN